MAPLCFVLMPFGQKPDPTGAEGYRYGRYHRHHRHHRHNRYNRYNRFYESK